ncbi:MAG TPA: ABC transporter ATP-binding protein [Dehalococcoidia bacterium]
MSDVRLVAATKRYGSAVALRKLDLDVPQSSFFALLGPSGCGKTTTLRLIAGFEVADAGEVWIKGDNVTRVPPHKRNFGMVFQQLALFPHLSVNDNVAFGLRMRRTDRREIEKRVARALDLVKLTGYGDRFPRQLSGGQQQRVALARAIVFEPSVLLLDEPLGALDKMLREEMQVELRELQRRLGITTVFVTHDQEEALTMSDFVAVMRDGEIEQMGMPREIYERPRTRFVAKFLGASNFLSGEIVGTEGPKVVIDLGGSRLAVDRIQTGPALGNGDSRLTLAVRPERISLLPAGSGRLQGTVTDVVYRGSETHVFVIRDGEPLVVHVQNASQQIMVPSSGQQIGLDFEDNSLVVLG